MTRIDTVTAAASARNQAGAPCGRATPSAMVAVASLLLLFVSASSCDEPPRRTKPQPAPVVAPSPGSGQSAAPADRTSAERPAPGVAKAGKPPQRPPPVVSAEVMAKAQALATEAANHLNEAKRAKQSADHAKFKTEITACWDQVHKALELVSPLREWEEEADLEGWAIPAEAAAQMKQFERWSRTKTECHKIKGR